MLNPNSNLLILPVEENGFLNIGPKLLQRYKILLFRTSLRNSEIPGEMDI